MSTLYPAGSRALQDTFDSRRLADRLAEVKVHDCFTPEDRRLIEGVDMFFMATVDASGQPTCSYKGGDPGFVTVLDDNTLAFPSFDGNGMFLSMGNVVETRAVGLLFIDFQLQRRMRVDGTAEVVLDDPMLDLFPGAQMMVRVEAWRIYPNCGRYIHHYQLVERSRFVPRPDVEAPVPGWKEAEWARDVLPGK